MGALSVARMREGALAGVRVLDLTSVIMGPYATQLLADLGAEVISIETVQGGENRRMGGGNHPEFSGISLNLLRNKQSVALDLKDPAARDALLALAANCDIFVTNLRPKPIERLGLTYESIRAIRPDVIYCRAQGFAGDHPRADDPAYDDIIQAESGLADANHQTSGTPQIAPTILADKVCGMAIAQAITAALFYRNRTGEGQHVEVPMMDVMRAFMLVEHGDAAITDDAAPAGYRRVLNAERGPQRTADGWINILPYSGPAFDALFGENGRADMVGDPRSRGSQIIPNARDLYAELRPIIATRTTAEWLAFCSAHSIPVGRIATLDELVAELPLAGHPDVGDYRLIPQPVRYSATPVSAPTPARRIGEDTRAALLAAGVVPAAVEDLFARGVAVDPAHSAATPTRQGGQHVDPVR